MTSLGFGPVSFSLSRPQSFDLEEGKTKLVYFWVWKKLGWQIKAITLKEDGNIEVIIL